MYLDRVFLSFYQIVELTFSISLPVLAYQLAVIGAPYGIDLNLTAYWGCDENVAHHP